MSDTNILDLLNQNLADVKTDMPLLPKNDYVLEVKSVEQAETKSGGQQIKISLATTEPVVAATGEQLPAGMYVFDQISLTPTEKYPATSIQKKCASFRQSICGKEAGGFFPLEQYVGRTLTARIDVLPEKDGYPAKNVVKFYKN